MENATLMERILYEVKKTVVGQDHFLERVLVAVLAQGHLLVEGVPGLAKTLTVSSLAGAIGTKFQRIQFTADLLPSDVTITEGSLVLTSGLGGNYPSGLLIGAVDAVEERPEAEGRRAFYERKARETRAAIKEMRSWGRASRSTSGCRPIPNSPRPYLMIGLMPTAAATPAGPISCLPMARCISCPILLLPFSPRWPAALRRGRAARLGNGRRTARAARRGARGGSG